MAIVQSNLVRMDTRECLDRESETRCKEIRRRILEGMGARDIEAVFDLGRDKEYFSKCREACYKELGYDVRDEHRIELTGKRYELKNGEVALPDLLQSIADDLKRNYQRRNPKAFGCVSPEEFGKSVDKIVETLLSSSWMD